VGSIDGMTNWDGNFVYDEAASTVYALGHGPDIDDNYLFTTNLRTRSTSSILLAPSDTGAIYYTVGGLNPRGQLVAAYWDGEKEVLVTIDPSDASTNVVGSLGDLKSWDNQLVYNATLSAVVALGWTPSRSSLHRVLSEMERDGLVVFEVLSSGRMPSRYRKAAPG
jgi:hypothetical protein